MKRLVLFLTVILISGGSISSLDLRPVGSDLSTFLDELGKEAIPYLQQNALVGDGVGIAHFADNTDFYIALTPAVTLSHGICKFIDDEGLFDLLNVSGLIGEALSEAEPIQDIYESPYFPYPVLMLNFGFALPADFEVSCFFSAFPQILTDAILQAANITDSGLILNWLSIGAKVRRPLLKDRGYAPAISLGIGYTFSSFNFGFSLPDEFSQDYSGTSMGVEGDISINTILHTAGIDLAISKKLLFFVPFLKFSSYYQYARYTAAINDFDVAAGTDKYSDQKKGIPGAVVEVSDLSFLFSGGFELLFGKFALVPCAMYSFSSNAFSFNFSIRIGF